MAKKPSYSYVLRHRLKKNSFIEVSEDSGKNWLSRKVDYDTQIKTLQSQFGEQNIRLPAKPNELVYVSWRVDIKAAGGKSVESKSFPTRSAAVKFGADLIKKYNKGKSVSLGKCSVKNMIEDYLSKEIEPHLIDLKKRCNNIDDDPKKNRILKSKFDDYKRINSTLLADKILPEISLDEITVIDVNDYIARRMSADNSSYTARKSKAEAYAIDNNMSLQTALCQVAAKTMRDTADYKARAEKIYDEAESLIAREARKPKVERVTIDFEDALTKLGYLPKNDICKETVEKEIHKLSVIFQWATIRAEYKDVENPARGNDFGADGASEARNRRFETDDEEVRFFTATKQSRLRYLYPVAMLLKETGQRRSEMLLSRWSDIDFEKRRWHKKAYPQPMT